MRIVHIQHPFITNKGYQENHLPHQQARLGHNVWILTSTIVPKKFGDVEIYDNYTKDNLHIKRFSPWFYLKGIEDGIFKGLISEIKSINPDIIHSHGIVSPRLLQSAVSKLATSHASLVVDSHVDNDNFHLNTLFKKVGFYTYRSLIWPLVKREINLLIAVNPFAENFIKRNFSFPEKKIRHLPLGVNTKDFFQDEEERKEKRVELDLSDDTITAIFAGNIEPTKNLEILIESFSLLVKQEPNSHLIIVGDGEENYIREIQKVAKQLGCYEKISFEGRVSQDQLRKYYNAADFGIWPGKLGVAIIEALGTGLPIIISKSSATSYYIKENNGLEFNRKNSESLYHEMYKYIQNPALLNEHSQNSLSFAQSELDWTEIAKDSIEMYREVHL